MTALKACRDRSRVLAAHSLRNSLATGNFNGSPAWKGCLDPEISGSQFSILRRRITSGDPGLPPIATNAAHPECARQPIAARRRAVDIAIPRIISGRADSLCHVSELLTHTPLRS